MKDLIKLIATGLGGVILFLCCFLLMAFMHDILHITTTLDQIAARAAIIFSFQFAIQAFHSPQVWWKFALTVFLETVMFALITLYI